MTRVRSTFRFEVASMWVAEDALGESLSLSRDGWDIRLELPSKREDFGLYRPGQYIEYPFGPFGGGSSGLAGSGSYVRQVTAIQVSVTRNASFSVAAFDSRDPDAIQAARDHHDAALGAAQAVAGDFVEWVRVSKDQPWLGMSHHRPVPIGITEHWDEDAKKRIGFGVAGGVVLQPMPVDRSVASADLLSFAPRLASSETPPLGETFLRDGQFLMRVDPPNPSQAVLLAAIGSEVKIKLALRTNATPDQLPFVEYVLERPRDVTQAASSLVDVLMKHVTGRSLKDEDKNLWKGVDKLFQDRNSVAHKAGSIELPAARGHLESAAKLFDWLDSL